MNSFLKFLAALGVIIAPVQATLIASAVLVIADLISGILAARKRGEAITSNGLRRTVSKFFIYEAVLIVAFIAEHYLIGDTLPLVKVLAGLIGMVEIKSVIENANSLLGGDIFKKAIELLGSKSDK